jgi:mono/diheme cytochrome c family protein
MRRLCVVVGFLAGFAVAAHSQGAPEKQIAHGKSLVEGVGLCVGCHTPKGADGRPDPSRWLQGAPLEPPGGSGGSGGSEQANRPKEAPGIAGLPKGWSEADMIKFLTTGLRPDGTQARPPMRPYRLSPEDAADVLAFLKSLKTQR